MHVQQFDFDFEKMEPWTGELDKDVQKQFTIEANLKLQTCA